MAEQTVTKQLADALVKLTEQLDQCRKMLRLGEVIGALGPIETGEAHKALDRYRAEPEVVDGCICPDCPRCTGAKAKDEDDTCCCWQAGHGAGLEAQRERMA